MNRFARAGTVASLTSVIVLALAHASSLNGTVVGITDGDTIMVFDSSNHQDVIRLAGICAPEHNQTFGDRSTQNLSGLVFGKRVTLDCGGQESYGRIVCKVLLPNGEDVDLDQVKAGMAWHYKQYEDEQSAADRKLYADAEDAARETHIGLWADPHPIQPWDFRHGTQTRLCFNRASIVLRVLTRGL